MEYILVFIIGLCIGSFLNVCIYRIPEARSILKPRSFCPNCKKPIPWYDNIPLLSFLVLRGRCRSCGASISPRYPAVELLTALAGVMLLWFFGLTPRFFAYGVFTCALIVIVFIDQKHREIPDFITIPGIFVGAVLMTVFRLDGAESAFAAFGDAFGGIFLGGLMMFIMGVVGEVLFRKEAVGGGDVKLMAMVGAFLGWRLAILAFFIAPLAGVGVALFMKIKYKADAVPYAPYLALGAMISLLWGNRIVEILFGISS